MAAYRPPPEDCCPLGRAQCPANLRMGDALPAREVARRSAAAPTSRRMPNHLPEAQLDNGESEVGHWGVSARKRRMRLAFPRQAEWARIAAVEEASGRTDRRAAPVDKNTFDQEHFEEREPDDEPQVPSP